ncbi:Uncharacterised protein [Bordetella pertussis]|nr:Uncharacterised protein [Bordetella pertussis]
MRGGLPRITSMGTSTGRTSFSPCARIVSSPGRPSPSTTRSWRSSVATPTTAYGQRSRRAMASKRSRSCGRIDST